MKRSVGAPPAPPPCPCAVNESRVSGRIRCARWYSISTTWVSYPRSVVRIARRPTLQSHPIISRCLIKDRFGHGVLLRPLEEPRQRLPRLGRGDLRQGERRQSIWQRDRAEARGELSPEYQTVPRQPLLLHRVHDLRSDSGRPRNSRTNLRLGSTEPSNCPAGSSVILRAYRSPRIRPAARCPVSPSPFGAPL